MLFGKNPKETPFHIEDIMIFDADDAIKNHSSNY